MKPFEFTKYSAAQKQNKRKRHRSSHKVIIKVKPRHRSSQSIGGVTRR